MAEFFTGTAMIPSANIKLDNGTQVIVNILSLPLEGEWSS